LKNKYVIYVVILSLLLGATANAHHSFSMFDQEKTISLTGTVKDWQWTNPHTWLILIVKDYQGNNKEWNIEGQSPQVMRSEKGVTRNLMKPSDKVVVYVHPRRDGTLGGSFISVKIVSTSYSGQP